MKKSEKPSFYAILPANIRYAEDLSDFQKLMYAEITALADKYWYCFASNSYFSKLYGKWSPWISQIINHMKDLWYLKLEYEKEKGNLRKIYIGELANLKRNIKIPISEKWYSPISQKWKVSISEKWKTPISQKWKHSNTSINNTSVSKEITHPKLIIWNSITWLSDIENSELKKSLDWLKNVSDNEFELRVKKFVFIKNLIQNTKSEKYFFFQIQERDLITFIKNINKFYGEDTVILWKLSLASERKKALRLVVENKVTEEIESVDKKSPLTEEDKKKAIALLNKVRSKI